MESIALIEKEPPENRELNLKESKVKLHPSSSSDSLIVETCYPCLAHFQYILSFLGIVAIFVIMGIWLTRMFTPTLKD